MVVASCLAYMIYGLFGVKGEEKRGEQVELTGNRPY